MFRRKTMITRSRNSKGFRISTGKTCRCGRTSALLLVEKGRYDEAIREFTLILASRPGDDKARFYLAMALKEKGELRRAITELLKMKSDSREYRAAIRSLPSLYVDSGALDEGVVQFEKLVAENSTNIELYLVLSALYERRPTTDGHSGIEDGEGIRACQCGCPLSTRYDDRKEWGERRGAQGDGKAPGPAARKSGGSQFYRLYVR